VEPGALARVLCHGNPAEGGRFHANLFDFDPRHIRAIRVRFFLLHLD